MLYKAPRKFSVRGLAWPAAKVVLVAEAVLFGYGYFQWRKLNTDPEARLQAYKEKLWRLESYYKVGELLDGNYNQRQIDLDLWRANNRI